MKEQQMDIVGMLRREMECECNEARVNEMTDALQAIKDGEYQRAAELLKRLNAYVSGTIVDYLTHNFTSEKILVRVLSNVDEQVEYSTCFIVPPELKKEERGPYIGKVAQNALVQFIQERYTVQVMPKTVVKDNIPAETAGEGAKGDE